MSRKPRAVANRNAQIPPKKELVDPTKKEPLTIVQRMNCYISGSVLAAVKISLPKISKKYRNQALEYAHVVMYGDQLVSATTNGHYLMTLLLGVPTEKNFENEQFEFRLSADALAKLIAFNKQVGDFEYAFELTSLFGVGEKHASKEHLKISANGSTLVLEDSLLTDPPDWRMLVDLDLKCAKGSAFLTSSPLDPIISYNAAYLALLGKVVLKIGVTRLDKEKEGVTQVLGSMRSPIIFMFQDDVDQDVFPRMMFMLMPVTSGSRIIAMVEKFHNEQRYSEAKRDKFNENEARETRKNARDAVRSDEFTT